MLVKSGESVFFLSQDFFRCFELFATEYDVSYGIVIYHLYYVEICSFYIHFVESFYYKSILNFLKSLVYIYWDDPMIFILQFINVVYHIDWFLDLEKPLQLWNKFRLIMLYDPFNVLLYVLLVFYGGFFSSMFISDIYP